MVFSEPSFLFLFFPAVLAAYFALHRSLRNGVLLAASLLFYAWGERVWTVVMLLSIGLNYWFGLRVGKSGRNHRKWLAGAIATNLALLIGFKYSNFLVENLNYALALFGTGLAISWSPVHLPIGISFYTFQAMSYVIDVSRADARPQRDPLKVGLYIALFPQLIAGPIVRYTQVEEEITHRTESWAMFSSGVQRFVIGLGKKVVFANTMGQRADEIFSLSASDLSTPIAWLGIISYTLQIYFDFSGYSDMAIGLGRMFGFQFLENFHYPYAARSITDFWRRWHISLSTWFRDYLYIPLGGNRFGNAILYRNLLIVFVLCGFWHGASWNFLIWGLLHGSLLVFERVGLRQVLDRVPLVFSRIYVLFCVLVAWVFFRADTLSESVRYLAAMFGANHVADNAQPLSFYVDPFFVTIGGLSILGATPLFSKLAPQILGRLDLNSKFAAQLLFYLGLLALSSVLVAAGTYNPFIYFRF